MKNYNKLLSLLITVALVYWGCEEPIEQEDETIPLRNSLNDPDMGDVGSLSGYFFNFTNGFNIKYNRYDANSINNPDLFDPEEDTLNFRSYAAYTLENGESNLTGYEVITPEMIADSGYADLTPIDSLRKNSVSNELMSSNITDSEGYLWRRVEDVVSRVSVNDIEKEIRAQINRARELGIKPGHIDTHMGTLYSKVEYAELFFNIAMEYGIPANVIEFTPELVEIYRKQGYPITDRLIESASKYSLPKIDNMVPVPNAKTYDEKKENFYKLIKYLKPGITEIYFHPSVETNGLKKITNSWQQRVWEAKMFSDSDIIKFLKNEGILFTNWKEMMKRYKDKI